MDLKQLYEDECKQNSIDIQNGLFENVAIFVKGENVSRFKFNKEKSTGAQLKLSALNNNVDGYIIIQHGKGAIIHHETGKVKKTKMCSRALYTREEKLMSTTTYDGLVDEWNGRSDAYDPWDCWNITEPVEIKKKIWVK